MNVTALYRYPVKSMQGEELDACEITERGVVGDRAYALIDAETGKLVSAKHPRKWASVLAFGAAFEEQPQAGGAVPPVRITLPDGGTVSSDDPEAGSKLSDALGRPVVLASTAPEGIVLEEWWPGVEGHDPYLPPVGEDEGHPVTQGIASMGAPPGTFFDFSPVHLITSATLARLRELYSEGRIEPWRFRPNLVIETDEDGFVENEWADRTIEAGAATLKGVIPVPRCVMTTLPQRDLPRDLGVLRTIARSNRATVGPLGALPCAGVYADVVAGGTVRRADAVRLV